MDHYSILGSKLKDVSFFYLIPFLLVIGILSFPFAWEHPVLVFIVFLFIDMGHAYATVFRTYFRKNEIQNVKYWVYPVIVFIFMFCWAYFGIPYLWSFLLYFTFFHHIRQYYGISAWYANKQSFNISKEKYHLYLLTIIPFIIFHMRNIQHTPLYQENELFLFGETSFTNIAISLYLTYLVIQIFRWIINPNIKKMLLISLIYPAIIHAFCFLYFKESFKAFIPLLVMHGISYITLVIFSEKQLNNNKKYYKIIAIVIAFVLSCVYLENLLLDNYDVFLEPQFLRNKVLLSVLASVAVLPNLLHYIYDSFIWKKSNSDFNKIMKT